MMSRERPAWQVRIRRSAAAAPVGAGVLCNDGQVVTCAHVISPSQSSASPMELVYIEFQFGGSHEPIPATVVPGGWVPERPDRSGDVAVLRLHGPPPDGALPAPLCYSEAGVWDHRYRAYGYPRGHERTGVWSKGIVVGAAEVEWLQLQADSSLGFALEGASPAHRCGMRTWMRSSASWSHGSGPEVTRAIPASASPFRSR
jgi:hypothetical protein